MDDAETILKMIEAVSPDDAAKLDEIDARFHAYKLCRVYGSHKRQYQAHPVYDQLWLFTADGAEIGMVPSYSTSRDALKAIRPEGWRLEVKQHPHSFEAGFVQSTSGRYLSYKKAPTEELAELHAIIQAIEYERNNEPNP